MELKNLKKEVLSFANKLQVAHLATVENNQPRVRGMHMWFADETGFYFHTGSIKKVVSQIIDNPKVELAFLYSDEEKMYARELRVTGEVEIMDDEELKARLLTERTWLNGLISSNSVELVIFRVSKSEAYFWDMEHNMCEQTIPRVKF